MVGFNWDMAIDIVKLLLAIIIGGIIGGQREKSGKPAGIRTLALVCMATTFFTFISIRYFPYDTARVLAGVITGIGFLGAGAIIAEGGNVRGLTTAATIWAVSIIGVGIGLGQYGISIIFAVLIWIILKQGRFKRIIRKKDKKRML